MIILSLGVHKNHKEGLVMVFYKATASITMKMVAFTKVPFAKESDLVMESTKIKALSLILVFSNRISQVKCGPFCGWRQVSGEGT